MPLSADHPRQKLNFYPDNATKFQKENILSLLFSDLQSLRNWIIAPPKPLFADEAADKEPCGGYLEIYSALEPLNLPKDIDLGHYEEVTLLISKLCEISKAEGLAFEIELDDDYVGAIERGRADNTLSEGFIGTWHYELESRNA